MSKDQEKFIKFGLTKKIFHFHSDSSSRSPIHYLGIKIQNPKIYQRHLDFDFIDWLTLILHCHCAKESRVAYTTMTRQTEGEQADEIKLQLKH